MAKSKPKRVHRKAQGPAVRSKTSEGHSKAPKREDSIEIIARGCLIQASSVLLCRNTKHGYLYLPGGHVEFGESAATALEREFLEECGVIVRAGALALVSEGSFATKKREHHEINLVFHVERPGTVAKSASRTARPAAIRSLEEGIQFEWVELSAVVDFDIRPTAAKAWLATLTESVGLGAEWVSEIRPA